MTSDIERAIEMLKIAAAFIREKAPERVCYYDGADCDGNCLADDCETAAEMLKHY